MQRLIAVVNFLPSFLPRRFKRPVPGVWLLHPLRPSAPRAAAREGWYTGFKGTRSLQLNLPFWLKNLIFKLYSLVTCSSFCDDRCAAGMGRGGYCSPSQLSCMMHDSWFTWFESLKLNVYPSVTFVSMSTSYTESFMCIKSVWTL